jgi:hypothetical protein
VRLFDRSVVGEVAAEEEHVSGVVRSCEERLHRSLPVLLDVDVGNSGDA